MPFNSIAESTYITSQHRMDARTVVCLLLTLSSCHGCFSGRGTPRPEVAEERIKDTLPDKECGVAKPVVSAGGSVVQAGEFPWVALLGFKTLGLVQNPTPRWRCGGTLITNRHVLSAAHCVHQDTLTDTLPNGEKQRLELWKVRLGEVDKKESVDDGAHPEDFEVEGSIIHKEWTPKTMLHDISIVILKKKVIFTEMIRPICLPSAEVHAVTLTLTSEDMPTVAGWGHSSSAIQESSQHLMRGRINFVASTQCQGKLAGRVPGIQVVIDDTMMCAGAKRKGACYGDSGGPLMYYYEPPYPGPLGRWYQIGIVSYGPPDCPETGSPAVYTRVSEHMPWILDQLHMKLAHKDT